MRHPGSWPNVSRFVSQIMGPMGWPKHRMHAVARGAVWALALGLVQAPAAHADTGDTDDTDDIFDSGDTDEEWNEGTPASGISGEGGGAQCTTIPVAAAVLPALLAGAALVGRRRDD